MMGSGRVSELCLVIFLISYSFTFVELSPFSRAKDVLTELEEDKKIDQLVERLEEIVKKSEIEDYQAKREEESEKEQERELEILDEKVESLRDDSPADNAKRQNDLRSEDNNHKRHFNHHAIKFVNSNKQTRRLNNAKLNLREQGGQSSADPEETDDDDLLIEGDMTEKDVKENNEKAKDHIAGPNGIHENPNYKPYNGITHQSGDDEVFVPVFIQDDGPQKRNFLHKFKEQGRYWANGIVPYEFDSSFPEGSKPLVLEAIARYAAKTCINIRPRQSESSYVVFASGGGCYSTVGKSPFSGGQNIVLNTNGCGNYLSTVLHEIFHALGSAHEQSRMDRSKAIDINWSSLTTYRSQYYMANDIETDSFDLSSVMQYRISSGYTIKDSRLDYLIRTEEELSYYDIKTITENYECTVLNNCPAITCQNAGFQQSDCSCKCPDGLQGSDCNTIVGDCGGVIDLATGETRTITSPNFGTSNYELGRTCTWMVRAPTGNRIRFNLAELQSYEQSSNCIHYISIRYNLIGQAGYKLCGDLSTPQEYITNVNAEYNLLMVQFDTTGSGPRMKGFTGTVTAFNSGCGLDPCKHGATCTDTTTAPYYTCACNSGYSGTDCNTVAADGTVGCGFEKDYFGDCVLTTVRSNTLEWQVVSLSTESNVQFTAPAGDTYARVNPYFYAGTNIYAELETDANFDEARRRLTFSYVSYKASGSGNGLQVLYEGTSKSKEVLFTAPDNDQSWHTTTVDIPSVAGLKITFRANFRNFDHIFLLDAISIAAVNVVNPCDANPCQNSGTCTRVSNTDYTCSCTDDWTGNTCQTFVNPCDSIPCQNLGTCTRNTATTYTCSCTADYTGANCQTFINPCDNNPCQNSATCTRTSATTYSCSCTADYTGTNCDVLINPCDNNPCQNSGTCTRNSATTYTCSCTADYTGTNCDIYINPCDNNPCQNSGTCTRNSATSYTCSCLADWTGTNCDIFIDPCTLTTCKNSGTCTRQSATTFTCSCTADYTGNTCETYLDPCTPTPCKNSGTCTRTSPTAFTCGCTNLWSGPTCETPVQLCSTNPCKNSGTCSSVGGSVECSCPPEWTGPTCETQVNPCEANPCLHSGSCTATSATSYTCACTSDYTGTNCETFIDPCDTTTCQNGGTCTRLTADTFSCSCTVDFTGGNCETYINPCDSTPCLNGATCTRNSATAFTCTCTADHTGSNCGTIIDPCDSSPCLNGATCNRVSASDFSCSCAADWTGATCEIEINPCNNNPCQNGGSCSSSAVGTFICSCPSDWTGTRCETSVTACSSSTCLNGGSCVPDGAGFTCSCTSDYGGVNCQYRQFRESFEDTTSTFLVDASNNDQDWRTNVGCTRTSQTGPCSANTGSTYSYFESSFLSSGDVGRLQTQDTLDAPNYCLCFAYHMYGRTMGDLNVLSTTSGQTTPNIIWEDKGERGAKWLNQCVDVAGGIDLKIIFEAKYGGGPRGDIAIDDVELTPNFCGCKSNPCYGGASCFEGAAGAVSCACPSGYTGPFCENPVDAVAECTFEDGNDKCLFQPDPFNNYDYNWIFRSGRTPSSGTGPFQASEGTYYLFIEGSGIPNGKRARISSTAFSEPINGSPPTVSRKRAVSSSDRCMAVDYNMHISDGTLRIIQKLSDGTENVLWFEDADLGPVWNTAIVNIPYNSGSQIIIEGERGNSFKSDIAIDNIRVYPGGCPCEAAGPLICQNGGTCFNMNTTEYQCACASDYEGTRCENRKASPCDSNPCNAGQCESNDDGTYSCNCPLDRTGSNCENTVTSGASLTSCTFEMGENNYCKFDDDDDDDLDDMDWRLQTRNRGTRSSGTGPSGAFEGSRYIYLEASSPAKANDTAMLTLEEMPPVGASCLLFAYSMYGSGMGSLSVEAGSSTLWTLSGDQGQGWHQGVVAIPASLSNLHFLGRRGNDFKSDIALDNVELKSGSCDCASDPCQNGGTCVSAGGSYYCTCGALSTGPHCEFAVAQPFVCDFEVADDPTCLFRDTTNDDFDWTLHSGSTASGGTGPSTAFQGQSYKYIEASPQNVDDYAELSTPYMLDQDGGPMCLIFHYHMNVKQYKTSLKVMTDGPNGQSEEFAANGFRSKHWQQGVVQLSNVNGTMITFKGTVGHRYRADIALDRIRLEEGYCRDILNHCSFEVGEETCFLHNSKYIDDFDFLLSHEVSNPSATSGTGPTSAQEGVSYAYIETSWWKGKFNGSRAFLTTEGIPFNNVDMCLSLYYHMKGAHIGSLIIYSGDGITDHTVQSEISGEASPPDQWHQLFVDIPANPNLLIDIVAQTIGGHLGDISIDNIRLTEGICGIVSVQ